MYGSSLMRVTLRPRDSRIAAREAEAIPLPREDTTPPVTKTNLVMSFGRPGFREVVMRDYTCGCEGGSGQPNAKDAKDSQRTRKNSQECFLGVRRAMASPELVFALDA